MTADSSQDNLIRQLMPTFIEPLDGGHVPVNLIVPNPYQPRKFSERPFDPDHDEEDAELAQSIREHGVKQPVGVVALSDGRYQLVWGERRWRGALAAGRETIPALILNASAEVDGTQQAVFALIENLQRKDLALDEVCDGIEKLHELTGYDWARIAQMLGKSERTLYYYRRLNTLSPGVREAAIKARLSAKQIDALASAPPETQADLLQQIVELGLPGDASREAAQTIAQEAAQGTSIPVAVAARKAAGGHSSKSSAGGSKTWTLSPMHAQIVNSLLAPTESMPPAQKGTATRRVKALLEQVEAMKLDLVDTRNAALLMSFDANLPSPSAVAMAQSVRATRIGKAMSNIQAGLDMIASAGELSGNEEHAVQAILSHLQEQVKELISRRRARRSKV